MKVAFQVILRNGKSNALQGCSCILCPAIWHKKIDVSDNTQALRRIKALDEIRHALQQHRLDINCVQGSYNARKSVEDAFVSRVVESKGASRVNVALAPGDISWEDDTLQRHRAWCPRPPRTERAGGLRHVWCGIGEVPGRFRG